MLMASQLGTLPGEEGGRPSTVNHPRFSGLHQLPRQPDTTVLVNLHTQEAGCSPPRRAYSQQASHTHVLQCIPAPSAPICDLVTSIVTAHLVGPHWPLVIECSDSSGIPQRAQFLFTVHLLRGLLYLPPITSHSCHLCPSLCFIFLT